MSFSDSSSIILIIGAIAILAFVVHGLCFPGKSVNRPLKKDSKEDQELINAEGVGKVRIVQLEQEANSSSVTQAKNDPLDLIQSSEKITRMEFTPQSQELPKKEPVQEKAEDAWDKIKDYYEINLVCDEDMEFLGSKLEELAKTYGFIRDENDVFCVYDNEQVVFRISSLEEPYVFPKDMSNFKTHVLAIYMDLPKKGKAFQYFKALNMAANCLVSNLGGHLVDNANKPITYQRYEKLAMLLDEYDRS